MNISFSNPQVVFLDNYVAGAARVATGYDLTHFGKAGQLEFLERKEETWRSLRVRFAALGNAALSLQAAENWVFHQVTTRAAGFTATVNTTAETVDSTHLVRVDRMAQSQKIASDIQTSAYTALGLAGTITIDSLDVEVAATDTLNDLVQAIETLNNATSASDQQAAGFTSTVGTIEVNGREITVPAGSTLRDIRDLIDQETLLGAQAAVREGRLYLAGTTAGQAITLADTSGTVLAELGLLDPDNTIDVPARIDVRAGIESVRLVLYREQTGTRLQLAGDAAVLQALGLWDANREIKNEVTAPRSAQVTVDGTSYTSDTNVIDDIIGGVMLTLRRVTSHAEALKIENDTGQPRQAIEDFVLQYNYAVRELNQALADQGALKGEQFGWQIRSAMISGISRTIDTLPESLNSARQAGLSQDLQAHNILQDSVGIEHTWDLSDEVAHGTANNPQEKNNYNLLADIGIIYDIGEGTLTIDNQVLEAALSTEPTTIKELFTNQDDSIASRLNGQMQDLINKRTGSIREKLQYIDFFEDMEMKNGKWEREYSEIYSQKRLEYSMLSNMQNLMFVQKENLQNAQNLYAS
jgi:flagellar capping protein FliD